MESANETWKPLCQEDLRQAFIAMRPERMPEKMRYLVELIGHEKTYRLMVERGGGAMYIPKLDQLNREIRNAYIVRLHDEGMKADVIAKRLDITPQHIYEILRRAREDPGA